MLTHALTRFLGSGLGARYHGGVANPNGRNPDAMRNLPLVAYRLTSDQRKACQAVADARRVTVNELAKRALLAEVGRVNTGVNMAGLRELTLERDP